MAPLAAETARLHLAFGRYPRPRFEVCAQCEPEWGPESVADVPLHALTLRQLAAVHVMSLDDDGLRYVAPRLLELLLRTPAAVLDFRVSDLKTRMAAWPERAAVEHLADLVDVVYTSSDPFESASSATVSDWISRPAIGERLQEAFFQAFDDESAARLSAAHELWAACNAGR